MSTALMQIRGLTRSYDVPVIGGLDLDVPEGSFYSLVGPNGCGKSTLLRILSGLEAQNAGDIELQGRPLQSALGRGHRVGVVFQESRLLPWRRITDNIVLAVRSTGVAEPEARDRAGRYLKLVGLDGFEHYFPGRISGGMQQRASIARALACQPTLLLMDEPFSALDAQNRRLMQDELLDIWRRTECTVLFVTHSIPEAIRLSTHVTVLSGRPMRARWTVKTTGADAHQLHEDMLALLTEEVMSQDRGDPAVLAVPEAAPTAKNHPA